MTKFNKLHPVSCVYWKHGAYWLVKKGRWERLGISLEETLAEYARRVQAAKQGKLPALIDEALATHFATAEKPLKPKTKRLYRVAANVLKRKFAQFDSPDQVKSKHIAKMKLDGAATPNATNRNISLLRTLFGYWLTEQRCDSNPCVGIKRFQEAKRTRLISMDEWWAVYEKAPPELRVIMKVAFLTGQRIGDVIGIRRSQLVEAGIQFKQQKTDKALIVKWSPDLRKAVKEALALHGGIERMSLFVGRDNSPPAYKVILRAWHKAATAAGVLDALPNDQRAQSATNAKKQGKNATKLLGHSSEKMTETYLRERGEIEEVDGPMLDRA